MSIAGTRQHLRPAQQEPASPPETGTPPVGLTPRLWPELAVISVLALAVRLVTMLFVSHPGYMDAYYYYHVAENIVRGNGLVEFIAWHYQNHPADLPQPSNAYWMPLASLVSVPTMWLLGPGFRAAQLGHVLLSALVPGLTYLYARALLGARQPARLAALLTIFSGTYFVYWVNTDNFTPFALAGAGALMLMGIGEPRRGRWWLLALAGALIAPAHLARADGILLLLGVPMMAWLHERRLYRAGLAPEAVRPYVWKAVIAAVALYLLGMLPWLVRNLLVFGRLLPAGGNTPFMREYNELFSYAFTPQLSSYLSWGLPNIVHSKLEALWLNLIAQLQGTHYYLLPLCLLGAWQLRREARTWPFAIYFVVLLGAMTLVFTFPGPRGATFHSSSALLPYYYTTAAAGLAAAVHLAARRLRHWNVPLATRNFGYMLLGFAAALAIGFGLRNIRDWNRHLEQYRAIAAVLPAGSERARVMVADPPGFYYASGRQSLAIPNDGYPALVAAAARYGVDYLILEPARPAYLTSLLRGEYTGREFQEIATAGEARIYRIQRAEAGTP